MPTPIWKSVAGQERLNAWYDKFAAKTGATLTHQTITTTLGSGNVLIAGPVDAEPLICLHGMRTGASFLLSELAPLLGRFRVYAPDLPGQSIRGPEVRVPLHDDSYARWLLEVMDGLQLPSANLLGVSWGGFVARLTTSLAPERVSTLSLLMPAGIANGSHVTGLLKMAFPLIRHKLRPTADSLQALLRPIFTTWDADWAGAFDCALNDMKMDARIPRLATDDELRALKTRTLLIVGDQDISFPGAALIDRATRLIPDLETELVSGCKHCPPTTAEFRNWLADRITTFIQQ